LAAEEKNAPKAAIEIARKNECIRNSPIENLLKKTRKRIALNQLSGGAFNVSA